MHTNAIIPDQTWGLPLTHTLLPEYMKELNYSTSLEFGVDPPGNGYGTTERNLYENGYQVQKNFTKNHYFPDLMVEKFEQIIHNVDPANSSASDIPRLWSGTAYKSCPISSTPMPEYTSRPERSEGTSAADPMATPTLVSMQCNGVEGVKQAPCRPWSAACLFDLTNDPNNLAPSDNATLA
ncbi:hypothetical protein BV898_06333 [Hypsibius exemplaris]|uniref:Uncharacterized protein n=1 Tax=Hypsibius exemplaris TaxID=2072580 RepID=A0A1W0WWI6_HYPEX|nr:hypothetical protein BV898_06333 [Hypsibius exemplaris]